ncbi:DUF6799 domain-containing protein [Mucilaginibacter xinganensis]|uniref:DUF6799 domain-containing protein n=1 Tax=Mucilaginibacter xinganensis TaxID=1234841 RepID=A0A223NSP4_9SPHI|nr:DUF6799 domain-containing protein [Mucilaginibacter xinganensis]ASU32678.1 hypothetical protein MuYL_0778 [Mucilaginibacter xinganensis]
MKKTMIALTAVVLSCSAAAQNSMPDSAMHKMSHASKHGMADCVMMKKGKMITMMNGKTMPMTGTRTMANGTMVMADGTCKIKGGKRMMLKEDQCVMSDGKIMKVPLKTGMMKKHMMMDTLKKDTMKM